VARIVLRILKISVWGIERQAAAFAVGDTLGGAPFAGVTAE